MGYPIPNIKAILERISNRKAKYYATLDLTSGYHQIPLAEESRKYTAFTSAFGLYEWLRVPMGLKAAGHYFQYVLATIVLVGIIYIACESYIDDILVFGKDEDEYFANLEEVLKRFKKHNITINPDKCVFGATEIVYVGHLITANGITHTRERIDKVLQIDKPTSSHKFKNFIRVVKDISPHIKGKTLTWTTEAKQAFEQLKEDTHNIATL
jgi:hypothetical protein